MAIGDKLTSKNSMKQTALILIYILFSSCSMLRSPNQGRVNEHFEDILVKSKKQYEYFSTTIPDDLFPKTFQNNKLTPCKSSDWVSGFYPGTLLYLSEQLNDDHLFDLAQNKLDILEKEQFNTKTHDLGFMMFCSFGNALRLKPSEKYETILLNSAKSLASRYDPTVKAIRSWDSGPEDFLVIIDNMMNLELLFWATEFSGDSSYYEIAINHANTTLKNHFRDDFSTYHVINYNPVDGSVKEKKTHQGAFDESSWARGQAWALYGYTLMYRATGIPEYLDVAKNVASFILSHPSTPEDGIPLWDFDAPPETRNFRDASAGAIIASALIELSGYDHVNSRKYLKNAERILLSLSSPNYFASYKTNGGFLLKHSVGHLPNNSEIDVPLTYGDYYFIEAISRYLNLKK